MLAGLLFPQPECVCASVSQGTTPSKHSISSPHSALQLFLADHDYSKAVGDAIEVTQQYIKRAFTGSSVMKPVNHAKMLRQLNKRWVWVGLGDGKGPVRREPLSGLQIGLYPSGLGRVAWL